MASKKINNDKYYTNRELAEYCVKKTSEIIGNSITEYIEPSAGSGVFLEFLDNNYFAFDIEPESELVSFGDYLKLNIDYKKGRCVIGNPPFGRNLSLAQKFYKKSVEISDYISFILPISQLNNTKSMYEFDLVYSEDLGMKEYSDRNLHCCLNIYKIPSSGKLNKKKSSKLKDISIFRQDSKKFKTEDHDIIMCYWGNGSAGKTYMNEGQYSAEYKIKINNDDLKDEIIDVVKNTNWKERLNCIAMLKIQQFHIIDLLREKIPSIN